MTTVTTMCCRNTIFHGTVIEQEIKSWIIGKNNNKHATIRNIGPLKSNLAYICCGISIILPLTFLFCAYLGISREKLS